MEPANQSVETIVKLAHGQVNVPIVLIIIPTFPVLVFLVMFNSVKLVIKKTIVSNVLKDTNLKTVFVFQNAVHNVLIA